MIEIKDMCKTLAKYNVGNRELHRVVMFQDGSGRVDYMLMDDADATTLTAFTFDNLAEFEVKAEQYLKELEKQ